MNIKSTISGIIIVLWVIGSLSPGLAVPRKDIVGYWTLELNPGFNLVSFPVLPDTPTLEAVIGNNLSAVEVSNWDPRLNAFRWARYTPEDDSWTGNLFLLNHGEAYWINLTEADENVQLRVIGYPEEDIAHNWRSIGNGWQFFGTISGQSHEFEELTPDEKGILVFNWNAQLYRFELAESSDDNRWYLNDFSTIRPDRGYIVYQTLSSGQPEMSMVSLIRQMDRLNPERRRNLYQDSTYIQPPTVIIVSNKDALAICLTNGDVCDQSIAVNVIREQIRDNQGGGFEPEPQNMGRFELRGGGLDPGRFKIPVTIGEGSETINVGDRVHLLVEGPQGSTTRSTSFVIPENERFITDVVFSNPLALPGKPQVLPREFSISSAFPNPFNDRFFVDIKLPETVSVEQNLYDLAGRLVSNFSQPMSAGSHRLTLRAGHLSAGIYLFQIKAGNESRMVKVAHVK